MTAAEFIEYMIVRNVADQYNAHLRELARCNQTDNLAGDTGERSGECGSLALSACEKCGYLCEFHERFCTHAELREDAL